MRRSSPHRVRCFSQIVCHRGAEERGSVVYENQEQQEVPTPYMDQHEIEKLIRELHGEDILQHDAGEILREENLLQFESR